MPAVKARVHVVSGLHLIPSAGQVGIGPEVILLGGVAQVRRAQVPTHLVGLALVPVVAHGVLRPREQVVGGRGRAGHGAAGIAHGHIVVAIVDGWRSVFGFGAGRGQ
jgi:hypothetical protein